MRSFLLAALILAAASVHAQDIWQINNALQSQYNQANAYAYYRPYYGAYYAPCYYGYGYRGYAQRQTNYELRQLRFSIENAAQEERFAIQNAAEGRRR